MTTQGRYHTIEEHREYECHACNTRFSIAASFNPPLVCPYCATPQAWAERAIDEPRTIHSEVLVNRLIINATAAKDERDAAMAGIGIAATKVSIAESALCTAHKALRVLERTLPSSSNEGIVVRNALEHVATARANLRGKFSQSSRSKGVSEKHLIKAIGHRDSSDATEGNAIVDAELETDEKQRQQKQTPPQPPAGPKLRVPIQLKAPKIGEQTPKK